MSSYNMKLYAFVAPKQSGKSTACNYLIKKLSAKQVNFKDGLIAELKQNFPDLLTQLSIYYGVPVDDLFDSKPPLVRTLMQNYGTEVRRRDNPDYWVNRYRDSVSEMVDEIVVTDDVRFHNEAQAVKALGGTLIRLVRTDMVNTDTHQSEQEQSAIECDYIITCNGGDLEHLYAELDKIVG